MLKELLEQDFGKSFPISGGDGQSITAPIVIDDESPFNASWIEMEIASCIYLPSQRQWRVIGKELLSDNGKVIEKVACEVKFPEGDQVVTEKRNFYFDLSNVKLGEMTHTPPCGFRVSEAINFFLPYQLEWLHFNKMTDNEAENPGMGVSVAYSAPHLQATIYIYTKQHEHIHFKDTEALYESEFQTAQADLLTIHPEAKPLNEHRDENMLYKAFDIDNDYSAIMLSTAKNHFFKTRITMSGTNDSYVFDDMMRSLSFISWVVRNYQS